MVRIRNEHNLNVWIIVSMCVVQSRTVKFKLCLTCVGTCVYDFHRSNSTKRTRTTIVPGPDWGGERGERGYRNTLVFPPNREICIKIEFYYREPRAVWTFPIGALSFGKYLRYKDNSNKWIMAIIFQGFYLPIYTCI